MTLKTPRSATPKRAAQATPQRTPKIKPTPKTLKTPSPAQPAQTRSAPQSHAKVKPINAAKTATPSLQATPKATKSKSKSTAKKGSEQPSSTALVFEEGQASLVESKVRLAVATLKAVAEKAKTDAEQLRPDLFEDEATRINVQVVGIKLPKDSRKQLLHV